MYVHLYIHSCMYVCMYVCMYAYGTILKTRTNLTSLKQVRKIQTLLYDGLHEKRRGIVRQNSCGIAYVCIYVCMYVYVCGCVCVVYLHIIITTEFNALHYSIQSYHIICVYVCMCVCIPLKEREKPPDKVCPGVAVVLMDWISGMCGAEDYVCMYICMYESVFISYNLTKMF